MLRGEDSWPRGRHRASFRILASVLQALAKAGSVGPNRPQIVAGRIQGLPAAGKRLPATGGSPSVCEPGAEAIRAMLAQLPSALEAFDDAGSVFLPPDPNFQDHDDDDDSFASQDTLLEDARTKHKRLARQRLEAASRDAKPVKTMPMTQPIVVKTPKKVQPPTPSPLTLDAVTKLATADVRRELEARGLRSAGPRSIAVARLRHALEPQQPTQKKSSGTGTGVFDIADFAISPDADRVAFGSTIRLKVSPEEHGAVEYSIQCAKLIGGSKQLYQAWAAPSLTKGQTYEHVFDDVGIYILSEPTHRFECQVEVYAVTGMKELREEAKRRKVEAKRRQVSEEKASQEKMRRDAEAKRRQEEAQRLEADERARAQAEAEKNDPKLRREAEARREEAVFASSHQWKMRPRTSHTGTGRRRRLHQLLDESRNEQKPSQPSTSHLAMPAPGQHKPMYADQRRPSTSAMRPASYGASLRRAPQVRHTAASILALPDRWVNTDLLDDESDEDIVAPRRQAKSQMVFVKSSGTYERRLTRAAVSSFAPKAAKAPPKKATVMELKARAAAEACRDQPKRLGAPSEDPEPITPQLRVGGSATERATGKACKIVGKKQGLYQIQFAGSSATHARRAAQLTASVEEEAAEPVKTPPPPPAPSLPQIIIEDNAWAPLDLIVAPGDECEVRVHEDEPRCVEYQIKCERILDYVPPLHVELFETNIMTAGEVFRYAFKEQGRYEVFDVDAPEIRGVIHVTTQPDQVQERLKRGS